MRGATECARRLKLMLSSLRSKLGKPTLPATGDPITQLVLGVLSRDVPEAKAQEGLDRLRSMVVDYNELRVIPPLEMSEVLHDLPEARLKCEDITRALNKIFAVEHVVSLERVAALPRKEGLAYLERIDGLEPWTRARIRLLGFGQHAMPLDEAMWALLRREEVVAPRAPLAEAQQFLERQIAEEDALEFFALLRRHAWAEMGAAVRKGEVERIRSVPPDRTSRNMLQALVGGGADKPAELPDDDEDLELDLETAGVAGARPGKSEPAAASRPARGKAQASGKRAAITVAPTAQGSPKAAGRSTRTPTNPRREAKPAAKAAARRDGKAARRKAGR